jgi:hypothetical protein
MLSTEPRMLKIAGKSMMLELVRRVLMMLELMGRVLMVLDAVVRMEETASSEYPHEPRSIGVAVAILRVCICRVFRAIPVAIRPVAIVGGAPREAQDRGQRHPGRQTCALRRTHRTPPEAHLLTTTLEL